MSNIQELKDVLKETLEERGVLSEIKSRIRAEIFNALNEKPQKRPELSHENLIINQLIKEYLLFNNYNHSLAVFMPETGQPEKTQLDRKFISKQLNIIENKESKELPLLYSLAFGLKKMIPKENDQNLMNLESDTKFQNQIQTTTKFPQKEQVLLEQKEPIYENIFQVDEKPQPFQYKSSKN